MADGIHGKDIMTLLNSTPFDKARARRRRNLVLGAIAILIVVIAVYAYWPYYMARRTVNQFMTAVVHKNFQMAYAIWKPDPKSYPMDYFMQDWGPGSRWGIIKSYNILDVLQPPGGHASGLVVIVRINGIHEDERLWVENKTHEMSFYQF